MSLPFKNVREQLLRAGVTPRYAERYVTELREHLADLIERERTSGPGGAPAAERALALMGQDADLVRVALERGAPRSLAARAPWAMLAVFPVFVWMAVLVATIALMMHLLWPVRGLMPSEMPDTYRTLIALCSFVSQYLVGLLLFAGCIAIAVRQRLASGWIWVGLGLVALLTGILGFHMHVMPPQGGHKGSAVYSALALVFVDGRPSLSATLGVWAVHSAVLFAIAALAYRILWSRTVPEIR